VLPEIAVAEIREDAPLDKVCYIGCEAFDLMHAGNQSRSVVTF
jgi:hypothetical protein